MTYTFTVNGGKDASVQANYHPFYITDDPDGGYFQLSAAEQQVRFFVVVVVFVVLFLFLEEGGSIPQLSLFFSGTVPVFEVANSQNTDCPFFLEIFVI